MTDDDAMLRTIDVTVERISRLLRGLDVEVQTGALGDLVAMWLGETFIFREETDSVINTDATDTLRGELFADWCDMVRGRIEVHAEALAEEHGLTRDRN